MTRLAAPIVLAELGWMAMGVVDTMVVGRVSAEAIAAVSLGAIVFYGVAVCGGGVLLGMDTLVSRAFGAGDAEDCRHSLFQGVWISLLLTPLVMGLVWALDLLLPRLGIDPAVVRATRPYLHALNWSAPALLVYFAIRRYLQAISLVQPVMWTLVTANLVNLAGNYVLVFGHLGAPRMGAEGSGWATCFSRAYMVVVLGAVVWRSEPKLWTSSWRVDFRRIGELLRLGLPAAAQMGVEIGVFAVVTMLVGRLSAIALASNQIALVTVSTTFMMPLGISSAAAVRVGNGLGQRNRRAAARSGWTALALGAAVMSAAAVLAAGGAASHRPPVHAGGSRVIAAAAIAASHRGFFSSSMGCRLSPPEPCGGRATRARPCCAILRDIGWWDYRSARYCVSGAEWAPRDCGWVFRPD